MGYQVNLNQDVRLFQNFIHSYIRITGHYGPPGLPVKLILFFIKNFIRKNSFISNFLKTKNNSVVFVQMLILFGLNSNISGYYDISNYLCEKRSSVRVQKSFVLHVQNIHIFIPDRISIWMNLFVKFFSSF